MNYNFHSLFGWRAPTQYLVANLLFLFDLSYHHLDIFLALTSIWSQYLEGNIVRVVLINDQQLNCLKWGITCTHFMHQPEIWFLNVYFFQIFFPLNRTICVGVLGAGTNAFLAPHLPWFDFLLDSSVLHVQGLQLVKFY
jgi:hypothetical protein